MTAVIVDQGIYVLQDNSFRWLQRISPVSQGTDKSARSEALKEVAQLHLHLPCGLVKGNASTWRTTNNCNQANPSVHSRVHVTRDSFVNGFAEGIVTETYKHQFTAVEALATSLHTFAGALLQLGVNCTVEADPRALPGCE